VATESLSPPASIRARQRKLFGRAAPACILLCVLVFYWTPLFSSSTSIHGDTADVHYPLQKYFADRLFSGHLPFWTPYLDSGYPILSSPLMGAWYPLNWPFFLFGVTPAALQMQLALHAALACLGTYFLLVRLLKQRGSAVVGAFAYGFSGFFAAHSAHLGVFAAAAWFPWLLLAYRRATEAQELRFSAMGGVIGGLMILSGNRQVATFGFIGLALFALAEVTSRAIPWGRAARIVIVMILGSIAISAVALVPDLGISRHLSVPAAAEVTAGDRVLRAAPLLTLVAPDWLGTISNKRQEPGTGAYFYGGLLLLPLALLGLIVSPLCPKALFLIIPAVWFMLGPSAGLYRLGAIVPWLQSGPPVYAWFLVAFALAALAAAGCDWIFSRGNRAAFLVIFAAGFLFGDLWYWNSRVNPLAYARQSYQTRYGLPESLGSRFLAAPQLPLSRFDSAFTLRGTGPLLYPLDLKFETTYGYLLPESVYYREYRDAMAHNPRLRDGLNVSRFLNPQIGQVDINTSVLPRAYFPRNVRDVLGETESRRALYNLDPETASTVLPPHAAIQQDPSAEAMVTSFDEQSYRIHYVARSPSLLKLSVAWYPGWQATMGSRSLPVVRVDHALMGVVVPEGEDNIDFTFAPRNFYGGALISVFAGLALLLIAMVGPLYQPLDRLLFPGSRSQRHRHRVERRSSI
jgi:hypothetical protein